MKPLIVPGSLRVVQCRMMLAGSELPGILTATVETNSHYQADTWKASFALNSIGGMTLDQWGADSLVGKLFVVQARLLPKDQWTSLITGEAEDIEINVPDGRVECSGKDLTSRFTENRTQETFLNLTASEVVTTLATRRGLTPVVTATTTLVTRYYQQDHDRISHDQFSRVSTEWDLMTFLAQNEGFDLFVTGTELHFSSRRLRQSRIW